MTPNTPSPRPAGSFRPQRRPQSPRPFHSPNRAPFSPAPHASGTGVPTNGSPTPHFSPRPGFAPRRPAASGNLPFETKGPLKEGFAREERAALPPRSGGKSMRRKRGPMGGDLPVVRMSTFKNVPTHKTGSDKDTLANDGDRLRVMVLGGNEEVGRNMTMMEYGNDIILIDMGLMFPDADMPGVDYIVPNISCLKGKEKNIRGVIITHAHYDHIGGIPHLMPRLNNPPLFATDLTCGIIQKRQEDHRDSPPLNLHAVKTDDVLQLGSFTVEFFGVAHSIPTSMGVIVNTPCGIVVHTGDFKLDVAGSQSVQETEKIKKLGERNVLALMADSTNASKPGRQMQEIEIQNNIDEIIKNAKGKIVIGTFASMIGRVQQIIKACERQGRKVAVEGFSMRSNIAIAQQLGYMDIAKGTLIETKEINRLPPEKVAIVCTGAQGEEKAVLMRIANHEHPFIHLDPGDTIVFSSSVIPGNERSVQRVKDTLYREGANVIHYQMMDVHAGGHAQQEDLKEIHQWIKPKYLIPIEGNYSFLCDHGKAAIAGGFDPKNIFVADNGQIIEFDKDRNGMLTNKKVQTDYVFVDGLGVGNTNQIVLRDRTQLAEEGVVIVVSVINSRTGAPEALPDIISRGFVYMKEHQELIMQARNKVSAILRDIDPQSRTNGTYVKDKVRDELGEFFYIKTKQRPMIIPVIIEV